jgi:streptomycin 6-kinase
MSTTADAPVLAQEGEAPSGLSGDDLRGLRSYLAVRFGPEAGAARVEPLAAERSGGKEGGYGVPYVVRWNGGGGPRALVLETVRPGPFGHEDASDRAGIVLRAAEDYATLPRHVIPVGVGAFRRGRPAASLDDLGEPFLLTEFVAGTPYANDLDAIVARGSLDDLDRRRVDALASYLAEVHARPQSHPTWWRRRLRELVGSGECIAGIADSYPVPCGFVTAELLRRVEALALAWRYRLRDRAERLRAIHGDFHPWNILFEGGSAEFRVLDRSRGALGDPADDVASLSANYLFYALRTAAAFEGPFAELFRRFWTGYVQRTNDAGLSGAIAPHFAFRALVLAHPFWYPHEPESVRRLLFRFLFGVLESDRFDADLIPRMLARTDP